MNIEILTLSEIEDVNGQKGAFTVSVKKYPRYIDMAKCIACGICAQKCPKKVDDEFNMGISKRKAAYIQYGQTVPLKYAIDPNSCLYIQKQKCRACEKFCPTGAINFDDKEEIVDIHVGSIILSPGYTPYNPSSLDYYGYGTIPDVVTSIEYERMLSASGPFQGHLEMPSNGKTPQKIAWIQCVGSRNTNRSENGYCSSVCCMYAIKQATITGTHIPDGGEQTIFYMDIRCHGKEFEAYYNQAKQKGIRFERARPHTIEPGPDKNGVTMEYLTESGRKVRENFDLAVLSIGMEVAKDAKLLAQKTGIELGEYNFAQTSSFEPVNSSVDGIYVSGSFTSTINIPHTVTKASTAATEASKALLDVKGTLTHEKTYPAQKDISGQAPRIGVFVCSCGVNIAGVVDVASLVEYAKTLPHVVYSENNMFSCSTDTQDMIAKKIEEHQLNRIVIAACSPRTHEPLFQDSLKEAGLNGYLIEMANIRNQNAWVHQNEPEKATIKAKDQVRMAVAKAGLTYPLEKLNVDVIQKALVIGGGVSGMNAALGMAQQGFDTVLVEKSGTLGGNAWHLLKTAKDEKIKPWLTTLIQNVESNAKIKVLKNASLQSVSGSVGNFKSQIKVNGKTDSIEYGAAIIATGAKETTPTEYMYGQDDRIMTHLQFDTLLEKNAAAVKSAHSVIFIQCVGSRDTKREYCSRICCTHSVKSAIDIKTLNPEIQVYILYRQIRTYGLNEELYKKARQRGVIFIRYNIVDNLPQVNMDDGNLTVSVVDPILQMDIKIDAGYLVLAAAIEPNDTQDLIELYKCAVNADGFINEAHPKLRPVDMSVDGLFVAGLCNYPKPIDESIAQAKAAVSRANVILSRKVMQLDAIKAEVTDQCDGCALCLDVCPFAAIELREIQVNGNVVKKIETNKTLCKGCGLCEATCPKNGVFVHGFTNEQLKAQVYAALDLPN